MDPDDIERLEDPDVFPESADDVELIQTHLSIVCLVGDRAYKLKKSIELPFADFTTLENRGRYCEEECRLNRRLCPRTYLDVVPLKQAEDGALSFRPDAEGEIVDHAVHMRRLPAEDMLDARLENDTVTEDHVGEIADQMVAFHAEAVRDDEVAERGDPDRLRRFALENFEETRGDVGSVFPEKLHGALEEATRRDFERVLPTLRERAAAGCVVDGHGDLHARNICLTEPIAIYDCIEFEPAFRCGDVATEHAFLIMDLRYRGHSGLADRYLSAVLARSGDSRMREIMPPLVRYRAMVRAKVSAISAGEEELSDEVRKRARDSARRYLRLAGATMLGTEGPRWLMLCGLPGCGKSTLADGMVEASGGAWPVFSSDRIRKELAGAEPTERLPDSCYTPEFSRKTYGELYRRAAESTAENPVVLLDANFRGRAERARAAEAAESAGARLEILHLDASEEIIADRLEARLRGGEAESDADIEIYRRLAEQFEPPEPGEADSVVRVSGERSPGEEVEEIFARLLAAG